MKYKYAIRNLDCANCAREVEEGLAKDERLKNVVVNFNTQKVSFEADEKLSLNELNVMVQKIEPEAALSTIGEGEKKESLGGQALTLGLGLAVGVLAYFLPLPLGVKICGYLVSYGLLLGCTARKAWLTLIKSHVLNEDTLITISCIGALMIGEVLEGMMVIALYVIGKILEAKALNKSRRSIEGLIDIKQPFAQRKDGRKLTKIRVEEIKPGDLLIVKKGERVPVDGKILTGETELDLSALTGESEKVKIGTNEKVLSGAINLGNVITVEATASYANSTVAKILELLEEATDRKAKTETVVAKISKIYTPVILILAILVSVFLPLIFQIPIAESIYRGLTFLVISCPCAIAISVPLSYFTGIGAASKQGILIKGSNYLDNLSSTKNIIFDKTGTLTDGSFAVSKIEISDLKYTEAEVIEILAQGEALSNHPIAQSILKLYKGKLDARKVKKFREVTGEGISYVIGKNKIMVGNKLMCPCQEDAVLHLNINGQHVASITINDGVKDGAEEAVAKLRKLGMTTYMFTGDKNSIARTVAKRLKIDHVQAEMLPTDKYHSYEKIASKSAMTVFVGDGINDAPVLKRADIGIAMGGVGSESAIEAADVVIMNDDLQKIPEVMEISHYTKQIIYQNLVFAISVKVVILILSVFGLANMWWAVFADTGVTLLAILNTLRIMYKFR